jgi:hypothetical protein
VKSLIEAYVGIWIIILLLYLCLAFTSINMNVVQARNILSDIKANVSASNGSIVDTEKNTYTYDSASKDITLKNNGYTFTYTVTRLSLYIDSEGNNIYNNATEESTFVYNDLYKVELNYEYTVPLFGKQTYPLTALVY